VLFTIHFQINIMPPQLPLNSLSSTTPLEGAQTSSGPSSTSLDPQDALEGVSVDADALVMPTDRAETSTPSFHPASELSRTSCSLGVPLPVDSDEELIIGGIYVLLYSRYEVYEPYEFDWEFYVHTEPNNGHSFYLSQEGKMSIPLHTMNQDIKKSVGLLYVLHVAQNDDPDFAPTFKDQIDIIMANQARLVGELSTERSEVSDLRWLMGNMEALQLRGLMNPQTDLYNLFEHMATMGHKYADELYDEEDKSNQVA
jgi:hypothetical protein